jgi:hypothetical protein
MDEIFYIVYIYIMNSIGLIQSILSTNKPRIPTSPLILWLDAKDPTGNGTVFSSNTTFSTWIDKSEYANNAIALTTSDVSTTISYLATGFNSSYPTFNFTGNNNRLAGTFSNYSKITGTSTRCFIVGSVNNAGGSAGRFIGFSTTYKGNDYHLTSTYGYLRQSNTGLAPYRNGVYLTNNPPAYSTPYIWEGWFDGTKAYATFLNGNSTNISSVNSVNNFNIGYYAVGLNPNPGDATASTLNGKISEILVYNGTLTTIQAQQTEAYLAYKWGLQNTLPSSNPYISSPPSNPYK